MSLTISEKNIIQTLPVIQQQFIQAKFSGIPIKLYKPVELELAVTDMIQVVLMESGHSAQTDKAIIKFISETIYRDIQTPRLHHLTLQEIKLAISNGVRFVYGPFMGINVSTIHSWIKAYLGSKERELAIKEFNLKLSEQEQGIIDRSAKANPEGQKRVAEALKTILKDLPPETETKPLKRTTVEKSDYDKKVQSLFFEFTKMKGEEIKGKKYVRVEGIDRPLDEVEYVEFKIKEYESKS